MEQPECVMENTVWTSTPGVSAGNTIQQSDAIDVYIAMVVSSIPSKNLYVVIPKGHTITEQIKIAAGPSGTSLTGSEINTVFSYGDTVVVAREKSPLNSADGIDLILCQVPDIRKNILTSSPVATYNEVSYSSQIEALLKTAFYNQATDYDKRFWTIDGALPGDTLISDGFGPNILVGREVISVSASNKTNLMLDKDLERIRGIAFCIETSTPVSHNFSGLDTGLIFDESCVAYTIGEGMGSAGEEVEVSKDSLGIYRMKHYCSPLLNGFYTCVTMPLEEGHKISGVDFYETPIASRRTTLNGDDYTAAISRVYNDKTPLIPCVTRRNNQQVSTESVAVEFPRKNLKEEDDSINYESILINEAANNSDFPVAGTNAEDWQRQAEAGAESFGESSVASPTLKPIGTARCYDFPETIELVDPATNEKRTYYASTSFIHQEPDGSIILADGYGSEIRMQKGNIIISPAVDLQIRPGRDVDAMVGRNASVRAQKHITMHSCSGSMYLKADHNLQMLSGVDKAGVCTIDNRGGGANVLADNGYSVVSDNIYFGITKRSSETQGAVTPGTGTLTLDAGMGSFALTGTKGTIGAQNLTAVGFTGKTGAGVSLSAKGIDVACPSVNVGTSKLLVSSFSGRDTVHVPVGGKSTEIEVIKSPGIPTVSVMGSLKVSLQMQVGTTLQAMSVSAPSGTFQNASLLSGLKGQAAPPAVVVVPPTKMITNTSKSHYETAHRSVMQDYFTVGNRFKYPASKEYGVGTTSYTLAGMRWQSMLVEAGTWTDKGVTDIVDMSISMPFPGVEAWNKGKVSAKGYTLKPIVSGYTINAIKQS